MTLKIVNKYYYSSRNSRNKKRTVENAKLVLDELENNPLQSNRRIGTNKPISKFIRIGKYDIKFYPYEVRICLELLEPDKKRQFRIFEWFLHRNERFIENFVVSDVRAFHMNGMVNRQNSGIYVYTIPIIIHL